MIALGDNRYGKSRVRVMRVSREGVHHQVQDWNVDVWLKGDFRSCFENGDNSRILPTDTMKNTVYYLARLSKASSIEGFATELVTYLLENNPQVDEAGSTVSSAWWGPLVGGGRRHDTAFIQAGGARDTATVTRRQREPPRVMSGFRDLAMLKTANSGFSGYIKDKLTTLKETHDRLLGTLASGEWKFAADGIDHRAARSRIMDTLLNTFATHDSLSVQQTLYAMGRAALEAEPAIAEIELSMPNKHCNLVDMSPFGLDNPNHIFVPTDEPHGSIEACVKRAN